MMMLSAVLLLIGFVALAGMVARVNQLGTQTTTESRKAALADSGALQDALDGGLSTLAKRAATATWTAAAANVASTVTVSSPTTFFAAVDVGRTVTGTGLPADTTLVSVVSATSATIRSPTAAIPVQSTGTALTLKKAGFALDSTTTPTLDAAVVAFLEQLQKVEAEHGLLLGYDVTSTSCSASQVILRLSDSDIKVEVRSSVLIPRAAGCADLQDGFFPFP